MRSQKSQICILNPNVWLGKSPFFPAESPPKWVAPGHPWSAKDPSTAQKQLAAQLAQAWYGGDDQDLQSSTGDFYRKCLGVFCLYHVLSMFVGRWRPITPIYPHVPKPLETLATNMILYIYIVMIIYFYDYIRQCLWGNADDNKALCALQTNPYPTDAELLQRSQYGSGVLYFVNPYES